MRYLPSIIAAKIHGKRLTESSNELLRKQNVFEKKQLEFLCSYSNSWTEAIGITAYIVFKAANNQRADNSSLIRVLRGGSPLQSRDFEEFIKVANFILKAGDLEDMIKDDYNNKHALISTDDTDKLLQIAEGRIAERWPHILELYRQGVEMVRRADDLDAEIRSSIKAGNLERFLSREWYNMWDAKTGEVGGFMQELVYRVLGKDDKIARAMHSYGHLIGTALQVKDDHDDLLKDLMYGQGNIFAWYAMLNEENGVARVIFENKNWERLAWYLSTKYLSRMKSFALSLIDEGTNALKTAGISNLGEFKVVSKYAKLKVLRMKQYEQEKLEVIREDTLKILKKYS